MESKVNNHCNRPNASTSGYAISLGLNASSSPNNINLQLHTETLVPQPVGSQRSSGNKGQGGFDCLIDEVAIWNRTLSDAEINTLTTKGLNKN